MAEKKRLNLSFSMAVPYQREAWKLLRAIPSGQRTGAICRMLLAHRNREDLLDAIRTIVREELQTIRIPKAEKNERNCHQTEDVDQNVLSFLASLQEEGDTV